MIPKISDNVWRILSCPDCGESLQNNNHIAICNRCQVQYESTKSGALDLRLAQKKNVQYEFTLGTSLIPTSDIDFLKLRENNNPQVDFSNFDVPNHLTKQLLSYFPRAKTDNSLMLDIGCGSTIHKSVSEHAGFEYVGLDYESDEAPILGDAHALPFKDESFEFILSIAVLEHIRFPFVMMKEAYRVLKRGGIFIGTVAFLESFHGDSFYHHTHLGTYNSLQEGGFEIEFICPSEKWTVLIAQANMALFPKMPRLISTSLVMPLQFLHRIWWRIGRIINKKATEETRIRDTTGAFTFIAGKKLPNTELGKCPWGLKSR